MLFRQLEYFVVLARERHFARAAAACYVSQPALSEAIRKLEHELNVPLVNRAHTYQGLTPEGERLVLWARRILADHDSLKQEVAAIHSGLDGQLRLGVIPAASTTAGLIIEPFCELHPLARVYLETRLPTEEIIARLQRFELGAGIGYLGANPPSDVTTVPLYRERHVLIGARALIGDAASLTWADVAQLPLCLQNPSMHARQLLDAALAGEGLSVRPQVETDSIASIYSMVAGGRWASVVPRPWIHTFSHSAQIRVANVSAPVLTSPIVLMLNATAPASVLGNAFAAVARGLALDELFDDTVTAPARLVADRRAHDPAGGPTAQ